MALREIRQIEDDDVLRKKCRTIEVFDKRLFDLLDDMYETMLNGNGVGLAAPQIGVLKRVAVIDVGDGCIELINPEIVKTSGAIVDVEGCLSVKGRFGEVERPKRVKAKALDRNGKEFIIEGEGLLARAICHELDHLDGVLFVDKVIRFLDDDEMKNRV